MCIYTEEKKSWSYVGNKANKHKGKTTMQLDLSDANCYQVNKRSLVVHEFGHALGLEHEYQHPDFWDRIAEFIDGKEISKHLKVGNQLCSSAGVLSRSRKSSYQSDYDPHSIMHFG